MRTLREIAASPKITKLIDQSYGSIPHVVLETHVTATSPSAPSRQLISLDNMSSRDEFWTIEARVVDYLGVISRDLGRELSFGEFLSGIAPDLLDPTMSPVISDAYHYKKQVATTHHCEIVKYSKRHQQTAVKWVRRTEPAEVLTLSEEESEYIHKKANAIKETVAYNPYGIISFEDPFIYDDVFIAEIQGDVKEVRAVKTRIGTILAKGSRWAELWSNCRAGALRLYGDMGLEEFAVFWTLVSVIRTMLMDPHSLYTVAPLQLIWPQLKGELNDIPVFRSLEIELPNDLKELGIREYWFDARQYWLNWDD